MIHQLINFTIRYFTLVGNMFPLLCLGIFLTIFVNYRLGVQLMSVWFFGYLLNLLLKNTIRKPRPNAGKHKVKVDGYSFPSGHAFISFTFYFSLVEIFEINNPWSWFIMSLPFLLGLSRLYLKVHDFVDVSCGWLFAYLYILFLSNYAIYFAKYLLNFIFTM